MEADDLASLEVIEVYIIGELDVTVGAAGDSLEDVGGAGRRHGDEGGDGAAGVPHPRFAFRRRKRLNSLG